MEIPENWTWHDSRVEPGEAAIFDLDGVISDAIARQHFLRGRVRDWEGFFNAAGDDQPFEDASRLVHVIKRTLQVVILTARPAQIQPITVEWLERHGLAWDLLVTREDGDRTSSASYKRRSVEQLRKIGFDPVIAFEDDVRNVEMLRDEGVPCVYIHSGYYDPPTS